MKKQIMSLLFGFTLLMGNEIRIDGLLESYHAWKTTDSGEMIGERNRLRLNFRKRENNIFMLASLRAFQNQWIDDSKPAVELYEAYVEYFSRDWDLRIGRQIFNWGKADGIRITDVLSPCDYTEFLTRDFDEIRMPVESVKFHYLFPLGDLELIWIPYFTPAQMPEYRTLQPQNPWYISHPFSQVDAKNYPDKKLGNSEWALQYSMFLQGIDISLSGAYIFDDTPVYEKNESEITPIYSREFVTGAALSSSVSEFVLRLEAVFIQGKEFQITVGNLIRERNSAKALLGLDWYPGNLWTISAQVANAQYIFHHKAIFVDNENNYMATLNINKKMLREKLEIENMLFFGFQEEDIFERLNLYYAITDNFRLGCGVDYFGGDVGTFGRYDDNDSYWIKATYNF